MTGTIFFIGLIAVALIIFFVIRLKKRTPKVVGEAVPISDPQEIKQLKKSMSAGPRKKMTNSQLIQMVQAETSPASLTRPKPEEMDFEIRKPKIEIPVVKESVAPPPLVTEVSNVPLVQMQKDLQRLEAENKELKEALQENAREKAALASTEHRVPEEEKDTDAESKQLKQAIQQEKAKFEELEKKFSTFKTEYEHQKSIAWTKEEVLQNQILQLKEDNEKLTKLKEQMEAKEVELNDLRFHKKETDETLRLLEKEVAEAKTGQKQILSQLNEAQHQASKRGEDLQVLTLSYEQKISMLTDKLLVLQQVKETTAKDEGYKEALEELRTKNEELLKMNQQFSQELDTLKEFNSQVREKEKVLQYELTKARAQSVGLEKICEDFKIHIERLSKVTQ